MSFFLNNYIEFHCFPRYFFQLLLPCKVVHQTLGASKGESLRYRGNKKKTDPGHITNRLVTWFIIKTHITLCMYQISTDFKFINRQNSKNLIIYIIFIKLVPCFFQMSLQLMLSMNVFLLSLKHINHTAPRVVNTRRIS